MFQLCIDGTEEKISFTQIPLDRRGRKKRKPTQPNGYAARPGTGLKGETCKSCNHRTKNEGRTARTYWKCNLMRHAWTGGTASDIRVNSPACSRWECL